MVKFLLIAFIFIGCGVGPKEPASGIYVYDVKPAFQPYVDAFINNSIGRGEVSIEHLTIEFGALGLDRLGECSIYVDRNPKIIINAKYWYEIDDNDKEVLLFHELGHCILRRKHNSDFTGFYPDSIMYPHVIGKYYKNNEEAYIDELYSVRNDWEESFFLTGNKTFSCGVSHGNN